MWIWNFIQTVFKDVFTTNFIPHVLQFTYVLYNLTQRFTGQNITIPLALHL